MKSYVMRALSLAGRSFRRTPLARSAMLNRMLAAWALRLHSSNEANVGPFRFRFDPRDRVIAKKLVLYGGYEQNELQILCSSIRPGDQVLDVGANIGIYSVHLSRAVGPTGRVVAVEPDPENVALLRENLEKNGCHNVTVVPSALADKPGEMSLFQDPHNRGHHSLVDLEGSKQIIPVSVERGETVLKGLGFRPRVAKIDVEGAEPLVLAGLGYFPEVLLFEFIPAYLRKLGTDPEAFLSSLQDADYELGYIDPDEGIRKPGTPASLLALGEADVWDLNILALRALKNR